MSSRILWSICALVLGTVLLAGHDGAAIGQEAEDQCLYESKAEEGGPALCIRAKNFNQDLCSVLEHTAAASNIPPEFFARLIWRESLFRPGAVSHKGAEGIAQFMPGTARLRGLQNSFDAIEALTASSRYLDDLRNRFGNLGLAAAAYNAGESGLETFLKLGRLPIETRDYVFAITGYPVETWRDAPPDKPAPPLAAEKSFMDGCVTLAETRNLNEPVLLSGADWAPWGVQLSAHYNPHVANRLFANAMTRLPPALSDERPLIVRQKGGNFGSRPRYAARIGKATRAEATDLCTRVRSAGVPCTVFKN